LIAVPAGGGGGFGPPTLETFAVVAAIGAVAVGPFAFAFLTLPAAAMWTTVLERSRRSTGRYEVPLLRHVARLLGQAPSS
jgi:hypothetical protein